MPRIPLHRPRPLRRAAAGLLVLAVASGCVGPWAEKPTTFEPVEVPAAWSGTSVGYDAVATTSAVDGLPALLAGVASGAGRTPHVELWHVTDDDLSPVDVDLAVDGAVQDVDVAAVPGLAVLAGSAWDGTTTTAFVRRSADGVTWAGVETGTALSDVTEVSSGVGQGRVWVLGVDDAGRTIGVAMHDGSVDPVVVAPGAKDVERRVLAIGGGPDQVGVLVGDTVSGNETAALTISADGGATWSAPTPVDADPRAWAGSVAWLGDRWLVTGGVPAQDGVDASLRPMSWTSTDGTTWSRDTGDLLAGGPGYDGLDDYWLGATLQTATRTVVPLLSRGERTVTVLTRSGNGWVELGASGDEPPQYDWAASRVSLLTVQSDTWTYAIGRGDGIVRVDRFEERPARNGNAAGLSWDPSGSIGRASDAARVFRSQGSAGSLTLDVERLVIEPADGGVVRSSARHELGVWSGTGGVQPLSLPVAELEGTIGYTSGRDPQTGAAVVFGAQWTGPRTAASAGWVQRGPDQGWTPVTGVGGEGLAIVTEALRVAAGWLAFGETAADVAAAGDAVAAAWASSDGVTWTVDPLPPTGTDPATSDSCTLADGTALVVGSVRVDGVRHGVVWRRDSAAWSAAVLPAESGSSSVHSCAAEQDGGAVLSGVDGDLSTVWRTADGSSVDVVWSGTASEVLDNVVGVPGGYAAYGSVETALRTGPVVWFSTDAEQWSALPVPARTPSDDGHVGLVGEDLAVVAGERGQIQVWVVRDARAALERAVSP